MLWAKFLRWCHLVWRLRFLSFNEEHRGIIVSVGIKFLGRYVPISTRSVRCTCECEFGRKSKPHDWYLVVVAGDALCTCESERRCVRCDRYEVLRRGADEKMTVSKVLDEGRGGLCSLKKSDQKWRYYVSTLKRPEKRFLTS